MKTSIPLAACVSTLVLAFAVDAQEGRQRRGGFGGMSRSIPAMTALDKNEDGALSVAEIANASAALKSLDANQDGRLAGDEFMPSFGGSTNRGGNRGGGRQPGGFGGAKRGPGSTETGAAVSSRPTRSFRPAAP